MQLRNIFSLKIFQKKEPSAYRQHYDFSSWNGTNLVPFDGEKTPMELGTPITYLLDYYSLRARSWKAYVDSDIVQNAIKKYMLWLIGSGLKLQADPVKIILENSGLNIDYDKSSTTIEAYFRLHAESKESSYNKEQTLHDLANEALKNAILSGDVLCVLRYNDNNVNIELIDGYYVETPLDNEYQIQAEKRGNKIIQGVEVDKKGTHIAYYVALENFEYLRILATGKKTKKRQAWLFYGLNHKINDVRGMSFLTAILETASKLDRYKDATLGNAEENAKVPYTIEHNRDSDGENPLISKIQKASGRLDTQPGTFEQCNGVSSKVSRSTSKQVYNMPIGSTLKRNSFESDLNFAEFFEKNSDIVYATLGIPPEVAMDKFGGAYSGSRAALKSWEYKMFTDREIMLQRRFYKPFYDFWLDMFVLNNKINLDGYLQAYMTNDNIILEAYKKCRFIGATVPHIDPVKEVNAERLKLGGQFKDVPLTTSEQSCEALNTGDWSAIVKKAEQEKKVAKEFNIETIKK